MKQGSTLFLRAVIFLIGIAVLALCIFGFPGIGSGWAREYPEAPRMGYVILCTLYATAIPFFFALYQALQLLRSIDRNSAFSDASVLALKYIKYCAVAMSVLYSVGLPAAFYMADVEDAPGVMLIALVFTCAPIVVAVFAAVLQKLLRSAIDIKNENDLMV